MKKTLLFSTILTLLCTGKQIQAQQRYLNDVFSSVTVTNDITYGQNKTVISGSPVLTDLKMDVYEPSGDTASVRPLVLVLHTGSFLPAVMNGQPTGGRKDSAVVEMCTRFAKKGYVAAAVSYRLGWNPLSSQQEVRTGTLINAAYRGVQDAHTCVRYFNMEAVTNGNPFKIDTNNVVVGGLGTGGYLALGYAYFLPNLILILLYLAIFRDL
jgi:acetyl esterase/lipase